jgi:hypothetical protein
MYEERSNKETCEASNDVMKPARLREMYQVKKQRKTVC